MALSFAHGSLTWNAADAATSTYTVNTLSFQPKFILLWTNGQASSTDAATGTTNTRAGYGFAASTSDRRCVGFIETDGAADADCASYYRDDAAIATVAADGTIDGLLDLTALASNGFTLTVDDQISADIRVHWAAWGGSDITNVVTGELTEPAATGTQNITGPGFQGNIAFFAVSQTGTTAPPTQAESHGRLMLGAATASGDGNQWLSVQHSVNGAASSTTKRHLSQIFCLGRPSETDLTPTTLPARASFSGFTATGFDLNWLGRADTGLRYIYAVIKGGQWKAGAYTIDNTGGGNTATVSGLAFQPIGGLNVSHATTEQTNSAIVNTIRCSQGVWASTTDRQATVFNSAASAGTMQTNLAVEYDQMFVSDDGSGGTGPKYDLDAITSDGFRVIVDVAGSVSAQFNTYVVFAGEAAGTSVKDLIMMGIIPFAR